MSNWFKALLAFLTGGGRSRTARRTDWHGRPVGENSAAPVPPISVPEADPYSTLRIKTQ
jgi:hypothetical protein